MACPQPILKYVQAGVTKLTEKAEMKTNQKGDSGEEPEN